MKRSTSLFPTSVIFLACASFRIMATEFTNNDSHAREIVAQMTLDEKISQLHGIQDKDNYRIVPGLPRLGIPALPLCNGPAGAGPAGPGHEGKATALPAPISLAATWDTNASRVYGQVSGYESADLGNVLLESPDVNIARTPRGGRTFESFGEDPHLAGQIAATEIEGIQSCGVIANVKHYAANNQECDRLSINEIIDGRTLREIYLPAFEAAVKEGQVASLMAAYNQVNGEFSCQNDFLLNQVLKKEWGFDGFVTSDFGAVHSTVPCAKAGLDLELPTGKYWGEALKKAVQSGEIPESLLDEKLVRRYRTMMRFGLWDKAPEHREIPSGRHAEIARKLGDEGSVLLKNDGDLLPLSAEAIHSIALIGPFAGKAMTGGGGSSEVSPILTVSPVEGIRNVLGKDVMIREDNGKDLAKAVAAATNADVVILMLGDRQIEGEDHPIRLAGNQDALAKAVLTSNPHAVVVLKSGGPVLLPWVNQARAILEVWYPGEEDGNVVADVLFGKLNPSGKLPITFPKYESDGPLQTQQQYPGVKGVVCYSEGVFVGYRWYDYKTIKPLFPFGYGLSYTTFRYRHLKLSQSKLKPNGSITVSVDITNTGKRAGAEVAELYIHDLHPKIDRPVRELKGFSKVFLQPGETRTVQFTVVPRDLAYFDTPCNQWKADVGDYEVEIGASSRDLRQHAKLKLNGDYTDKVTPLTWATRASSVSAIPSVRTDVINIRKP